MTVILLFISHRGHGPDYGKAGYQFAMIITFIIIIG